MLRAACEKQQSDEIWKKFVTVEVNRASTIDVIKVALGLGISKDKISFQSSDPKLVEEARKYLPRDRAKCKTNNVKKRKRAVETLGADAIATPVLSSAAAVEAALADPKLRRVDVQVSNAAELDKVLACA